MNRGSAIDIDKLSAAEKREVLAQLLTRKAQKPETYPLSFAQQRLYFIERLHPGTALHHIPIATRMLGTVDPLLLERALHEVVRRHASLRTTIAETEAGTVQVIAPAIAVPFERVDLTAARADEREPLLRAELRAFHQRPFDLSTGPLLRVTFVRIADTESVLFIVLHHISGDGWSVGVLVRELGAVYGAYGRGAASPLGELGLQYADAARWQRARLTEGQLAAGLAYWRGQLGEAPAVLQLSQAQARPATPSYAGRSVTARWDGALREAVQALAQREGATLFMVLLAAFQVLLARYSGQPDVVVGTPVANRPRPELEGLIGLFVNTVALRTQVARGTRFVALLRQVKETCLGAYAHQEVPFERLVEALQPGRDVRYPPVYQVLFALQNTPVGTVALGEVTLTPVAVASETAKFDLTLSVEEQGGALEATLEYSTALFSAAAAERMLPHLETLLRGIVADPAEDVWRYDVLPAAERALVVEGWNAGRPVAAVAGVAALVAAQVARQPGAVAVIDGERQVRYGELAARATQLAGYLRTQGVGPEVLVAVALERTVDLVVAVLAVWKAGGAYVPLDPSYPAARLGVMLDVAPAAVLVTRAGLEPAAWGTRGPVVCVDRDAAAIAAAAPAPDAPGAPEGLSHVIFTSGSTGTPKAVGIRQGSVSARLAWARARYTDRELRGVLAATSLAFDLSVFELWGPLAWGGTVILAESVLAYPELPARGAVRLINTVPSAMRELVGVSDLAGVVTVNLAGEALSRELATAVYAKPTVERVYNLYGPSEDTTYSTEELVARDGTERPRIGRGLPGTTTYVLDEAGAPVPVGVAGELAVGGVGVARGYLGRADLTAARFGANPFGAGRLYRTGDLVRAGEDGRLEYLGRLDQQVKVRGYRIELGDIDAALRAAGMREAVVVAQEGPGGPRLVGYGVPAAAPWPTENAVQTALAAQLPGYMVPAAICLLDAFPLTPNGKLDRHALPAPGIADSARTAEYVAPRNQTEAILSGIWTDVLSVPQVGATDDFFDLGGHSLLVMTLSGRINRTFDTQVPLRQLFEASTLGAMAQLVDARRARAVRAARPPIEVVSREGALPLSFSQQRLWFLDQFEPGTALYNVPAAVRMTGPLDAEALEQSFADLIGRHESLRTSFHAADGRPAQSIAPYVSFALERADLIGVAARERVAEAFARAEREAQRPFDLAVAPLLRVLLITLADEDHLLVMTLHHIVSDEWSLNIMVAELSALYRARTGGPAADLPPLSVQPVDVAVWQQRWLEGGELDRQLDYWRGQLAGPLPLLDLPVDRARPKVPSSGGATCSWTLDRTLVDGLRALARREGVTLFMTLLSLYKAMLFRLTRQPDVCVGSPIANRSDEASQGLVGFFVNSVVLRTAIDNELTLRQLLARVRTITLDAFANQDVPFEKLVEDLQPDREAGRSPLFQTMFSFQNGQGSKIDLPGLSLSLSPIDIPIAKFELSLAITEHEGELQAAFEYSTDLFDRQTIERFAALFELLAAHAVSHPDAALSALPVLSEDEEKQLDAWGSTGAPAPWRGGIVDAFRACAERDPDHAAVEQGDLVLSYGELDARSADLAARLRASGVGADVLVGIYMPRTPDLIVALLAVLRAGGGYVPLDPAYPAERIAQMLADARPRAVLTCRSLADALPAGAGTVVAVDDPEGGLVDGEGVAAVALGDAVPPPWPEDTAYVIYTSGTTGRPKGVQIPHAALANYVEAACGYFGITAGDRVLQFSTISFDTSVEEIFCTLTTGATLVLRTDAMIDSIPAFLGACERARISVVDVPTAYWHTIVSQLDEQGVRSLHAVRLVVIGGEQALAPAVARWSKVVGDRIRLVNAYGPTETTIAATMCDLPARGSGRQGEADRVPIGRPVPGLNVHVLDEFRQRVPVGATGELFVGGAGLARGYLGDEQLTQARFVQDPFATHGNARLYRTGDLVRYRADGLLEYMGRADQQVKIRGYRIELGDVEAAISRHPSVLECAVAAREDTPGDRRLVAYAVLRGDAPLTLEGMRTALRSSLPEYMHPAAIVTLPRLPLSANGKVDRRSLPAPVEAAARDRTIVSPRTDLEAALVALFREVLGLEQVSVTDDFFELGGHSLLATQLLSRINRGLEIELSLRQLFGAPTVERLAIVAEDALIDQLEAPELEASDPEELRHEGVSPLLQSSAAGA
jgi:amino acid adenylation domain-containing protein